MSERYHGSHGHGGLKISGNFWLSGPQRVGEGGVPEEVAALFRALPDVRLIALEWGRGQDRQGSAVFQRIPEEANDVASDPATDKKEEAND